MSADDLDTRARQAGEPINHKRPMGLAPWPFKRATLPMIEAIDGVLAEYRNLWPLTARQVYYRLIGLGHPVPKTKVGADSIGEKLVYGRRCGRWPWWAIRDDGAVSDDLGYGYDDPGEFWDGVRTSAEHYGGNLHVDQPRRVIVWCEAAGMVPQLDRALTGLPVNVVSGGGQPSVTIIHATAEEIVEDGRPAVLLYVGDLDERGKLIEDRLAHDLAAFVEDLAPEWPPPPLRWRPVAVTADQTAGLPAKPDAPGEYQAEALPPDEMARLVREAVEEETDLDAVKRAEEKEAEDKAAITEVLDQLPGRPGSAQP